MKRQVKMSISRNLWAVFFSSFHRAQKTDESPLCWVTFKGAQTQVDESLLHLMR